MALITRLSEEKRYAVADALVNAWAKDLGNGFTSLPQNVQFGILMNKQFAVKGKAQSLKTRYVEDIASHICNLIRRRVNNQYSNTVHEVEI